MLGSRHGRMATICFLWPGLVVGYTLADQNVIK